MASFAAQKVATVVGKKMLNQEFKKYSSKKVSGEYDPLFEMRPNKRGKMKKCKKLIPAYIPEHDALILAKVRKRAYHLDMALFNFLGIRFGWSSVVGLIPEIGDVIDLVMAMSLFRTCCKVEGGLDKGIKIKMLMWIFIDFVIGLVPILGDLLDATIKANTMNCRMLEEHLDKKYKTDAVKAAEKEEKRVSGTNYKPPAPATVYEDFDGDEYDYNPPASVSEPQRPSRVLSGRGGREPDVEMGLPRNDTGHGGRKSRR
jgi:hypothetical protein